MPKGRKIIGNIDASSQYTSNNEDDSSTITKSEDDTMRHDINEPTEEETERLPMNEAIAFTSMINSNIDGRLQDLFHDTNYHFKASEKPDNVGSYIDDSRPNNSKTEFQNDQLFGELRPQINPHQNRNNSSGYPMQVPHPRLYPNTFASDTDSSPEIPKLNNFELNSGGGGVTSAHSTPANFQYNYSSFYSPKLKQEFDQNYLGSPNLSENGYLSTPASSSLVQPPIPFMEQTAHKPSTGSTSNTASSSKQSHSTSSRSSAPNIDSDHETRSSNDSTESPDDSSSESRQVKKRRKPQNLRGGTCTVCGKVIRRDMTRHMRIHEEVSRFKCIYPRGHCIHKTGFFNRQYDFKKHLLHFHFEFDDSDVKKLYSLNEKLPHWGTCPCGLRFTGGDWLDGHILTNDTKSKCSHLTSLNQK